jgi:hypothetical protein
MKSTRNNRKAESEFAERLAAKYDLMTMDCLVRMQFAGAEATAALLNLADGSHGLDAISDKVEKILHAGFREAIGMLPPMPISRRDFDVLPVLPDRDDGRVGLGRKALRSFWIIVHANSNGTGVFYRPEIVDGAPPLH